MMKITFVFEIDEDLENFLKSRFQGVKVVIEKFEAELKAGEEVKVIKVSGKGTGC